MPRIFGDNEFQNSVSLLATPTLPAHATPKQHVEQLIQVMAAVNMTQRTPAASFAGSFESVYFGEGYFVAVGGDASSEIQYSINGEKWTVASMVAPTYDGYFGDVSFDGTDYWIAVGSDGEIRVTTNPVSGWGHRTAANSYAGYFSGVAYGNGTWVIVGESATWPTGDPEVQTSTDNGLNWTHRTPATGYTNYFASVAYGNGVFVAVGDDGEIQSSPDGITWTHRTADNGFVNYWRDVTYANGIFVATGAQGEIQTSPDGATWTHRDTEVYPPNSAVGYLEGAAYGNGVWCTYAVGNPVRTIQFSLDNGVTWKAVPLQIAIGQVYEIAYGNNMFVAVGYSDSLVMSSLVMPTFS